MSTLVISNLTKSFHKKIILEDVSVQFSTGDILGIFGRNGTGKSTLLQCMFGILDSDSIVIRINNKEINPKDVIASKKIGYLPQDSFLPKEKKVRDIIPIIFPDGEDQDKIFYTQGIHKIENQKAGTLSLGELRYLEVVLLCHLKHDFLLMDEPFSMIQPLYKELIKELLYTVKKTKGIAITDHYYQDVLSITDTNVLLKDRGLIPVFDKKDLVLYEYLTS
ncbi:ATP-binding cassette domain-containing protein [Aquimarina addita]|uniref:ATP-binding cassette domain-containing protein n=1 Tax=Aquimarina addita TaxID=870485 RepID=A0ABP7XHN8_9FLAO